MKNEDCVMNYGQTNLLFFVLCSVCDAQEVTKYTWAFKLINESYSMKTLFFAVDSEFDLNVSQCYFHFKVSAAWKFCRIMW